MANYSVYENDHVHGPGSNQTGYESSHTHGNYDTDTDGSHGHPAPSCNAHSSTYQVQACTSIGYGSSCASGACVDAADTWFEWLSKRTHIHAIGSIGSSGSSHSHGMSATGVGVAHRHAMGTTGATPGLGHRHQISQDTLWHPYMYDITISADLWTTADEDPYHAHSGEQISQHGHGIAEDGKVLLKNTQVTLTYMAQEED